MGAGYHGIVYWSYQNEKAKNYLLQTGLPSSNIKTSDKEKMKLPFEDDTTSMKFVLFLIGFLDSDGSVRLKYSGSEDKPLTHMQYLRFYARDDYILLFINDKLKEMGCRSTHTRTRRSDNLN